MPPQKAADLLSDEHRQVLDSLVIEGRASIDEIVSRLASIGVRISRSAIGRYRKQFDDKVGRDPEGTIRRKQLLKELAEARTKPRVRVKAGRG